MRWATETTDLEMFLSSDDLLVLAGLPGAGKSTLLRHAANHAGAVVLDTDQIRAWFSATMPSWVRYRWYRPVVHLTHRSRILVHAARRRGPVIAHEPATRAGTRAMLVTIGLLTGRARHLLWVRATPGEAAEGQRARGRVLGGRSFARHVRRARRVEPMLDEGGAHGWTTITVLPRPAPGERLVLRAATADEQTSDTAR